MIIQWNEFKLPAKGIAIAWMRATLNRRGIITINRAAFRTMGQPQAVELLFDQVNSLIGLRPASPSAPNAIKVSQRKDAGGSYRITAKNFCNYYQISTTTAMIFNNIQRQDDGTLILPLKEATELRRRRSGDESSAALLV